MRVVCVCQYGHNRSQALAYLLSHDCDCIAVAIGFGTADAELKQLLFRWSDRIAVLQEGMQRQVPAEHAGKVCVCDVGPDSYGQPRHPLLMSKLKACIAGGAIPGVHVHA